MRKRHSLLLMALIVAVAAPTGVVTAYYLATRDPRVRPLALSREAEAKARARESSAGLVASVEWGTANRLGIGKAEFAERIAGAFLAHGEALHVVTEEVPGARSVLVTYRQGANRYGPLPAARAAEGVRPAIEAFRLSLRE